MKIQKFLVHSITTVLFFSAACASQKTKEFQVSSSIPAANGVVKYNRTDNQNVLLDMTVEHLASPNRVDTASTTYIVWGQPTTGNQEPQNLGALTVDKNLTGKFQTVLPHENFQIFVTAEPSRMVQKPGSDRLLWTTLAQQAE